MHSVLHTVLHDVWCERDAGGSQSPRRWEDEPPRTSPGPMTGRTSELGVTGRGPTSASTAWAVPGHADAPVWLTKPQRPPAFVGFDMYHAIGSEQDAKNALNRPIPVPSKTAGGEPKKVLDGTSDSGTTGGRPASGSKTPPPPKTTPAATGTPSSGGTTDGSSAGTGGRGRADTICSAQASPSTTPPRTPSNDPSPPPPSQPSKQAPPPAPQPPKEQ